MVHVSYLFPRSRSTLEPKPLRLMSFNQKEALHCRCKFRV